MNTTSFAGAKCRTSFPWFILVPLLSMPPLVYSAETNAQAAKPPAPPGRLIDLGGYKMHLFCTGQGSPTVILSPGSGDFSFDWALVQPGVAKLTRVCSYDRGGEAWSDLGPMSHYSTQGRQIIVPGAGHHIQLEQPDVVVDAIREVLVATRKK